MPSLFSTSTPHTVFQIWIVVYVYVLPIMLHASWATLSLLDMSESGTASRGRRWGAAALLLPLIGGAAYLLFAARTLRRPACRAAVIGGLLVWLIPLIAAVWLAGGPLGPKALS